MLDDIVTQFLLLVKEWLQPGRLMLMEVLLAAPPDLVPTALKEPEDIKVPLLSQLLAALLQRVYRCLSLFI